VFWAAPQGAVRLCSTCARCASSALAQAPSLARGQARPDSDIDVAVSFGKPMSSDLRLAVIGIVADVSGRSVDLVDLEAAGGLIFARALGGTEILCDSAAARQRMIAKVQRSEDDRLSSAIAARAARAGLFA